MKFLYATEASCSVITEFQLNEDSWVLKSSTLVAEEKRLKVWDGLAWLVFKLKLQKVAKWSLTSEEIEPECPDIK